MLKLSILCLFISIASFINHIDDTDETYGYWEPLHFISFGIGMQTWEYCSEYAIRSYAFVIPFLPLTYFWNIFHLNRVYLFIFIKGILGLFFAISSYLYLKSIKKRFGSSIELYTFIFLITSPGIFFSSTAYLPSAVCSSLIMYSFSSWLNNKFLSSIFFGCIAVLWSGWPFVGVIFLPIGLDMLYSTYIKKSKLSHLFNLIFSGILIVLLTGGIALTIDSIMYGKMTFPPLNIALYNAFGGTGDELYGVEPASYYILNLLLMLGPITFPLAILSPFLILLEFIFHFSKEKIVSYKLIVLITPALIWLGIMFSRPHKEERFLYPIYPILITMASYSLVILLSVFDSIVSFFDSFNSTTKSSSSSTTTSPSTSIFQKICQSIIKPLLLFIVISLAFVGFTSRVHASYRNYGGYIKLWKETNNIISSSLSSEKSAISNKVCMGGDWYTFPSHFFLPTFSKLHYVEDNFHGLLPQLFPYPQGSSIPSVLPVNDQNREEKSRYIDITSCDYIVTTLPSCLDPVTLSKDNNNNNNNCDYEKLTPLQIELISNSNLSIDVQKCENIIDPVYSTSSLGKAYSIPYLSSSTNHFKSYCLYKVLNQNK